MSATASGAGSRSVTRRPVRTSRPGMVSSRRRRVRAVGMTVSGRPISVVHLSRVVRERGDHGPGGVGQEVAGREVRQRLVFEVADRELHDGMLTVL